MCIPTGPVPNFICQNPTAPCYGIRWWDLWGVIRSLVWTPYDWNYYSYKRDLTELPSSFHHVRTQQEVSSLQPKRGPSLEPNHDGAWSWTSSLKKNKFLLFISHQICGVLLQQLKQTKTVSITDELVTVFFYIHSHKYTIIFYITQNLFIKEPLLFAY